MSAVGPALSARPHARFAALAGMFVAAVGVVVLAGWALDVAVLKSLMPGWPQMSAGTALALVFAGTALWCAAGLTVPAGSPAAGLQPVRRRVLESGAALVVLIGLIKLGDHLLGWESGVDRLWLIDPAADGRISSATTGSLLLSGTALLLSSRARQAGIFQALVLCAALIAWLGLSRHLYGGEPLSPLTRMAAHSAGTLFVLSAGMLCLRPDGSLMALVMSDSAGGLMARWLLPAAMFIPVAVGWLHLKAQQPGWLSPDAGLSLFALSNVILFGALVWATAARLHRTDIERKRAERAGRESQRLLEAIIDNSAAVIYVKDLEGRYLLVNRRYEEIFGLTRAAILGKTDHDLFSKQAADAFRSVDQRVAASGTALTEEEVAPQSDGPHVYLSVKCPLRDAGGNTSGVFGISTDITERKRIEEAFRASQQLLQGIVESSDDAIISKNPAGIITSWNPGAEKLFGFRASEAIGHPVQMLVPPERAKEGPEILQRVARGETVDHFETVRMKKDGTRVNISATISPIKDAEGRVIGASQIARDITERKRTQDALAASERHYRLIFEQSPLPKWIYDPASLRFLAVNEAAQAHYGYSAAEFLAMTIQDIRPPEDVPALRADVAGALGSGPRSAEWRHRKKDGALIDVIVNAHDIVLEGRPARLVVAQDITERKQSEARMQAHLARLNLLNRITRAIAERQDLRSIFQVVIRSVEESLPVDFCCVCLYDPANNVVTVTGVGVRSAALAMELAMTEHARIDIDENGLSRGVRGQLVYEPDVSAVRFPFPQRLARGGLRALVAAPLLVESKVFGLLLAARRRPHSFGSGECEFLKQVTEHVALASHQSQLYDALQKAYDDLRQTQQAILQQERLRALGQMASGIAHDINNAISPVALYTESLLEKEPNLSAKARGYLTTIQHAIGDVAQTVGRMREFYRQREPQLTLAPVHLNALVNQVVDLTRARWSDMPQQRGVVIELQRELAADLPPVMGVESEIREALINLIFNSVDAMPDGGTLFLRSRRTGGGDRPPQVEVQVGDTGVGMNEDTRRRCLEPFFTTKGERGTGLGLAMVYGTVQRHSADLDIESIPGRGTTVSLRFAVTDGSAGAASAPIRAPRPLGRLRLLLVDDDPLLIRSLRDILEADGHEIATATGGQEGIVAFRAAQQAGKPFAAVITDLGMPHVDGRQVAQAIKAASPATPIILLTGWGQRLVAEGDMPPHVDRVLSKPPKLHELRDALAAVTQ